MKGDGDPISGRHKKRLCGLTKRWGDMAKGRYCKRYEYRQLSGTIAEDGIPVRNRVPDDYRTRKQWEAAGRKLKESAVGVEMHANRHSGKTYMYYLVEDTEGC